MLIWFPWSLCLKHYQRIHLQGQRIKRTRLPEICVVIFFPSVTVTLVFVCVINVFHCVIMQLIWSSVCICVCVSQLKRKTAYPLPPSIIFVNQKLFLRTLDIFFKRFSINVLLWSSLRCQIAVKGENSCMYIQLAPTISKTHLQVATSIPLKMRLHLYMCVGGGYNNKENIVSCPIHCIYSLHSPIRSRVSYLR